jgi:DNA-binding NtrC family response regulator
MIKAVRQAPTPSPATKGAILYCENDAKVLSSLASTLERAGFRVEAVQGRAAAEQAIRANKHDIVVLGHTLTKDDRHHLPYMAKRASEETQVLVLHASGKHHAVDHAMDSRDGEQSIIAALNMLAERSLVAC